MQPSLARVKKNFATTSSLRMRWRCMGRLIVSLKWRSHFGGFFSPFQRREAKSRDEGQWLRGGGYLGLNGWQGFCSPGDSAGPQRDVRHGCGCVGDGGGGEDGRKEKWEEGGKEGTMG